jgi:cytoskeletal protein CcmA (bactofilin family)
VTRRDSVFALSWSAEGTIKVTGEVDVGIAKISGALSVGGAITADALTCRGALDGGGPITIAGTFVTDGSLHAVGPVQAKQASFGGTTRLGRDVVVEGNVTVKGQFAAPSLRVGELHGEAAVEVEGSLDAVDVQLRLRGESRLGVVRARTVRLERVRPNPIEWVFGRAPPISVSRIEADRAELEGVEVGFVRCPEVILGRDAHVTEIEGTVVRRHSTARVGPRSKTPPPYGLSR